MVIKDEFDRIIKEYGSYYLYIRKNKKKICSCVDTLHKTPRDDCNICLGTGYVLAAEKINSRMVTAAVPETLPRAIKPVDIGEIIVPSKQFYIPCEITPKRKDLIIVCQWKDKQPLFDDYTDIYEINEVEPLIWHNGQVVYYIAYTHGDPINASLKLNLIRENSKLNYYVAVR